MNTKIRKISFVAELWIGTVPFVAVPLLMIAYQNKAFWSLHSGATNALYYGALLLLLLFSLLTRARTDEMTAVLLSRVDQKCFLILSIVLLFFAAFIASPLYSNIEVSRATIGLMLFWLLTALRILRVVLFCFYDKMGLPPEK